MRKTCTRCGEEKNRSEFWRHHRSPDGLQYYCKHCCIEFARARSIELHTRALKAERGTAPDPLLERIAQLERQAVDTAKAFMHTNRFRPYLVDMIAATDDLLRTKKYV